MPNVVEGEIVRVTGVVRALDEKLVAPLSGTSCVVLRSRVSAGLGFTRKARWWRETFAMVPFVIERAEGNVSIEGEHALLDLPPLDLPRRFKLTEDQRRRRDAFLRSHQLPARNWWGEYFYFETVLVPGTTVSVAGLVMKDVAGDELDPALAPVVAGERGFRDGPPTSLRLAGNAEHPLVIGVAVDRKQLA